MVTASWSEPFAMMTVMPVPVEPIVTISAEVTVGRSVVSLGVTALALRAANSGSRARVAKKWIERSF